MAVWRMRSSKALNSTRKLGLNKSVGNKPGVNKPSIKIARPLDSDLDMRRSRPAPSKLSRGLARLLRWMLPEGDTIGPPRRSIAREIEEEFPSNDF